MSIVAIIGQACSYVALAFGVFFFLFACKYYVAILIALFSGRTVEVGGNGESGNVDDSHDSTGTQKNVVEEPFVSIQLPLYNERNVARRIIQSCIEIDYSNYEIVVADDSRDETIDVLKDFGMRRGEPKVKIVHRKDRTGFKGGALQRAVEFMDPRAEYIVVLDADFIPPPDIIRRFLMYFERPNGDSVIQEDRGENGNGEDILEKVDDWFERRRLGVVQGYQLHHLNKNENWITRGVRTEFSGGYMIERVAEEFFGALKMITGSVFMIRADILRRLGWTYSITEDWDLTLRMYLEGYKVLYTPLIQAPAEIPATLRALARQRMRWAEGHTFAVKKYFWDVLRSDNLTGWEKLEFLYFAPYYLQSFFFLVGTFFWIVAEMLDQHPFFWTATFGWCLILSNLFSLPLMGLSGLYLERTAREDFTGIFSLIVLSYLMTPFQAYAAIKGLLEKDEGGWVRTFKTGSITDWVLQIRVRRLFSWIIPRRGAGRTEREEERRRRRGPSVVALIFLILMTTIIVWVTATAMTKPAGDGRSTALSFEYVNPPATVNTIETSRILTHPDYTDLSQNHHTDSHKASSPGWRKAWSFYLHGPLEQDYRMNGRMTYILHLRADDDAEVDIRIRVREVDVRGKARDMVNDYFTNVDLDDSSNEPVILEGRTVKSKKFCAGRTFLVEILLKTKDDDVIIHFDYGSEGKHSRIEFPGIVVPESLIPLLLIAPMIPGAVLLLKRRDKP